MKFARERWYLLAILSGVLLMLTFYPFHVWPLSFIALVPVYLAVVNASSKRNAFLAAFLAASMVFFEISFLMVAQFHWLPGSELFVNSIRYGGVIAAVVVFGGMWGLWGLGTYLLQSRSVILTTFVSAALYILGERAAQLIVDGYFIPTLAYEVTLPFLMSFAGVGGALFVTFIIVWVNVSIAEGYRAYFTNRSRIWIQETGVVVGVLALLYIANTGYLAYVRGSAPAETFSIATIQLASLRERTFGTTTPLGFDFPQLEQQIAQAGVTAPDLIVYPGSLVGRTIEEGETNISQWIASNAPPGSTLMTWDNTHHERGVITGFRFWQREGLVGEIQKKSLMPFMDYAPQWARSVGYYPKIYDVIPGSGEPTRLGEVLVGGLVCSEVHRGARSRESASNSAIIIAAGSEAMFEDDVASEFSVRAAQYRAAEGDVPVVRANIIGPSAIIASDGSVVAQMPMGEGGILLGSVEIHTPHRTIYTRAGDAPLFALVIIVLWLSVRARSPGRQGSV